MSRRKRKWWNSFAIEQSFKQRALVRVLGLTLVYVGISTVVVATFYQQMILPFAGLADPRIGIGPPNLARAVTVWATLMMGMSALFATATGLYFGHKLAGPIYRFKIELGRIADGRPVRPIVLRKGDEFHDVADALNRALDRIERAESALTDTLHEQQSLDVVREVHLAMLEGLGQIDVSGLGEADQRRLETWRERLDQLRPKLESQG